MNFLEIANQLEKLVKSNILNDCRYNIIIDSPLTLNPTRMLRGAP